MQIKFYKNPEIFVINQNKLIQELNIILICKMLILNQLLYQKKNQKNNKIYRNKMMMKQLQ